VSGIEKVETKGHTICGIVMIGLNADKFPYLLKHLVMTGLISAIVE